MAINIVQKEMIKIRKLVIDKLIMSIENNNAGDALSYMALLKEMPSYVEILK